MTFGQNETSTTPYRAGSGIGRILGWTAIIAGAAGLFLCRSVFFDVADLATAFVSPPPALALTPVMTEKRTAPKPAAIETRDPPSMEAMPTRIDPRPRANMAAREAQPPMVPVQLQLPAVVAEPGQRQQSPPQFAQPLAVQPRPVQPQLAQPQFAAPAASLPQPPSMARPVNALPTVETPHARVVTGMSSGGAEAVAERQRNGHFGFNASINGNSLPMMFDTGAGLVTLRIEDAARVGIDPARLNFSGKMSTANGITTVAQVVIETMTIGGITVRDVNALVAPPGALGVNLIGQSFMTRLAGYNVDGDRLILRGR